MTMTTPDQLYAMIDMIINFLKNFYVVGSLSLFKIITTLMWFGVAGYIANLIFGKPNSKEE